MPSPAGNGVSVANGVASGGDRPEGDPRRVGDDGSGPRFLPPLASDLMVFVKSKDAPKASLSHDIRDRRVVLPVKPGDLFRLEATANRDAYFYLLQVDTEGNLWSLYPWGGPKFEAREKEEKRRWLEVPQKFGGLSQEAPITDGPAGLETLLLLVRDEALSPEDEDVLRRSFTELPKEATGNFRCVAWFRNGEIIRNTPDHSGQDRGPILLANSKPVDDLLPAARELLRSERIKKLFPDTVGLSFPRE